MDLSPMREAMHDPRGARTCSIGIVVAADNGGASYEVRSGSTDIWVRVQLQPTGQYAWCRLAGFGGSGTGVVLIPHTGAEVVVLYPGGDHAGDPVLVAVLSTGAVPAGTAQGTIVVTGDNVKITALGSGTVSVNGGSISIPKLGDQVTVSIPSLSFSVAGLPLSGNPLPVTCVGTITSATAGDSRLKG